MTSYVADTERILALVDRARSIGSSLEQRLGEVEREVAALHLHWDGDAAEAHRSKHDTWAREMADMKSALAGLETAALSAHERYIGNVEHNTGMWP